MYVSRITKQSNCEPKSNLSLSRTQKPTTGVEPTGHGRVAQRSSHTRTVTGLRGRHRQSEGVSMKVEKRKTRKGVINATIKLLSNKDRWTQGTDAVNKHGNPVFPNDPNAERFCVRGALRACSANQEVYKDVY